MSNQKEEVPYSRENAINFFSSYVQANREFLQGKRVFDISAGSGYIGQKFADAGADVRLYDLFPEQNNLSKLSCMHIDLQSVFPIEDKSADIVICTETIEHLPNQYFFFKEVSRITKDNGSVILTTPNPSSLRSRFSQFIMESEHYSNPAPNETDVHFSWDNGKSIYFNKIFISGVLRLRTLASIQNLIVRKIHHSPKSSTSALLLVFFPLIYFFSRRTLKKQLKHDKPHATTYTEIFRINTSMNVLLGKHLIMEFIKKGH